MHHAVHLLDDPVPNILQHNDFYSAAIVHWLELMIVSAEPPVVITKVNSKSLGACVFYIKPEFLFSIISLCRELPLRMCPIQFFCLVLIISIKDLFLPPFSVLLHSFCVLSS